MRKYTNSRLNGKPITAIKLSAESEANAAEIEKFLEKNIINGITSFNATIEVFNEDTIEVFDYSFDDLDTAQGDVWHDAFLCDFQDDRRIEVLK